MCSYHNTLPVKTHASYGFLYFKGSGKKVTSHMVRKSLKCADFQGMQKKAIPWYWTGVETGMAMTCARISCLASVFISPQ